jgi:hypothetical protein
MRVAATALLGLLGAAVATITLGAFAFSTFCWEYCEPEDAPTVWDGVKFALPFGLVAVGLMTAAVLVGTRGRRPWPQAAAIALGLCVVAGALFWGVLALVA